MVAKRREGRVMVSALGCLVAVGGLVVLACSGGAIGVGACRSIETARCDVAPSCPGYFNLQEPTPSGDPVAACIRYYDDECLHGLAASVQPGGSEVSACVAEIQRLGDEAKAKGLDAAGACALVAAPENIAQCSFLAPAATTSDDAGGDANDGGPEDADTDGTADAPSSRG